VLAVRSPVFKTMFTCNMKEGKAAVIELTDVDKELFTEMLKFIYSGNCSDVVLNERTTDMFALADKYDLKRLKCQCEDLLFQKIAVNNVASVLQLADMFHSTDLRKFCIEFVSTNFPEVIITDGFKDLITTYPLLVVEVNEAYHDKVGTRTSSNTPDHKNKKRRT